MYRREALALFALLIIVVGFPVGILAYRNADRPAAQGDVRVIDLVARAPEAGGWSQELITVNVGDTVRLHIASHDVVHGFAIGRLGIDVGHIVPGEETTVEFVANEAGRFTFYCNVWCSNHHYRMRGTLEVLDPSAPGDPHVATGESDFVDLDIDSPHPAAFYPRSTPSAERGQSIADRLQLPAPGDLRGQSPSDRFRAIRAEQTAGALSDDEIWDLVAYHWSTMATPERLEVGAALYAKNCAACHGETGGGDGPGGRSQEKEPTAFSDPTTMAGGTSQIYYAKIRRGGMGTGMPFWGAIFDEEETWSLVYYLWSFLFDGRAAESSSSSSPRIEGQPDRGPVNVFGHG